MKIPLRNILARAKTRPVGYLRDVLSRARIVDEDIELSDADFLALLKKYNPNALALTRGAVDAVNGWIAAGLPLASPTVLAERQAICAPCPAWDSEFAFGVGRCRECGCTGLKLRLATQECPLEKWPAVPSVLSVP